MFQFDADLPTTDSGTWAKYRDSEFKIAHISNMKFQRTLARLQQPHRRKIEQGAMDPAVQKDILCKAMAEGILLDWKKVVDKSGAETAYKPEHGYTALSNDPEFRDFVSDFSMSIANYREEAETELGNS